MSRDISRVIFNPAKRYSGVRMQQGRVLLDDDWNESQLIDREDRRLTRSDLIGPAGTPDQGFRISNPRAETELLNFEIETGTFYLGGHRIILGEKTDYRSQRDWLQQPPDVTPAPDSQDLEESPRFDLVYLETWQQPVSAVEDRELREVALGGPDTSTRMRTMHRVRVETDVKESDCGQAWKTACDRWSGSNQGEMNDQFELEPDASLSVQTVDDGKPEDLCSPDMDGGYLGAENQAIRVQLADTSGNSPQLTWGFNNASPLYRVKDTGDGTTLKLVNEPPDEQHQPQAGQTVEILPRSAKLPNGEYVAAQTGRFFQVNESYDSSTREFTLKTPDSSNNRALPDDFGEGWPERENADDGSTDSTHHYMRIWDRGGAGSNPKIPFTPGDPVELGHTGLKVMIEGTDFVSGDHWILGARPETPNELFPWKAQDQEIVPHGPRRYRAPLALIQWDTEQSDGRDVEVIHDCRERFQPQTRQEQCCTYTVGDGVHSNGDFNSLQEAVDNLPETGGEICLLPGEHTANLLVETRSNVIVKGCGKRSYLRPNPEHLDEPVVHLRNSSHITIDNLNIMSYTGTGIILESTSPDKLQTITIQGNQILARTRGIDVRGGRDVTLRENNVRILDREEGETGISVRGLDVEVSWNDVTVIHRETPELDTLEPPPLPEEDDESIALDPQDPCFIPRKFYAQPVYMVQYSNLIWNLPIEQIYDPPYQAHGGIHIRGGSREIRFRENAVHGGSGNGFTLGGTPFSEGRSDLWASNHQMTVDHEPPSFLGVLQDPEGNPLTGLEPVLRHSEKGLFSDISDDEGIVRMKLPMTGRYFLEPPIGFTVENINPGSGDLPSFTVVLTRTEDSADPAQRPLNDLVIENNEISRMGKSGIGFAKHSVEPEGTLLSESEAPEELQFVSSIFLPEELLTTNTIEGVLIRENEIHHCFRASRQFESDQPESRTGQGGISLGPGSDVTVCNNDIHDNGLSARDPVCGIYVVYSEGLEITDNEIRNNGALTEVDQQKREGFRSGVFVRFASSIVLLRGTSDAQKWAVRIRGNYVEQPAGRALTVFCLGPATCVDNRFQSEQTGNWSFMDDLVGTALIANLGGLSTLMSYAGRTSYRTGLAFSHKPQSKQRLPRGDTLFNSNQIQQGEENRSLISHVVLSLSDVGYDGNHSSVFNSRAVIADGVILSGTLRATDNRFQEFPSTAYLSLFTASYMMNNTTNNQGDYCIVSRTQFDPTGGQVSNPARQGNMEIDTQRCDQIRENPFRFLLQEISQRLFAPETEPAETYNTKTLQDHSQQTIALSLDATRNTQVLLRRRKRQELMSLEQELGSDHYRVQDMQNQLQLNARVLEDLAVESELVRVSPPTPEKDGSLVDGRITNENNRGLAGNRVELMDSQGNSLGHTTRTDPSGYYSFSLKQSDIQNLESKDVHVRVLDPKGQEVVRSDDPLNLTKNAFIRNEFKAKRSFVGETFQPTEVSITDTRRLTDLDFTNVPLFSEDVIPDQPGENPGLESLQGIGPQRASALRDAGIDNLQRFAEANPERLNELMPRVNVEDLQSEARNLLES